MGTLNDAFSRIVRQERFERLVAAFEAACRWELYNTTALMGNRLLAMGAWIDDAGEWRHDTRPHRPIVPADEPGASPETDGE